MTMRIFKKDKFEIFLRIFLWATHLGRVATVGFLWHRNQQAYALTLFALYVLNAIQGVRDRINETYWDRKR